MARADGPTVVAPTRPLAGRGPHLGTCLGARRVSVLSLGVSGGVGVVQHRQLSSVNRRPGTARSPTVRSAASASVLRYFSSRLTLLGVLGVLSARHLPYVVGASAQTKPPPSRAADALEESEAPGDGSGFDVDD